MTPAGPEYLEVELPLIQQLVSMGWQHTRGSLDDPAVSHRESFREVYLLDELRAALHRINLDERGSPWLDEGRLSEAASALLRLSAPKLMEANQSATDLLLKGTGVEGVPGWDGGRARTVQFIDWACPENNACHVVSQFRVDEPGGQAKAFVVPDLVLFVNGIPLAVVECKSPGIIDPIPQAIDQLQRYANQRSWVDASEGNERLFHTNQLLIATCKDRAAVGTIGAEAVHYVAWKDTSPIPMAEVAAALGKSALSSQEILTAGMLRPAHLLDVVRHFSVFDVRGGRTVKIVGRYQQFRAVQRAILGLRNGDSRGHGVEHDARGGIIWHTQGSGKSLTMVFLARKMRSDPTLRRFKIVVVTDRTDLQKQLSDTAALTGDVVTVARSADAVKTALAKPGPGLVFAMIQKYRESVEDFPVLNEDPSILVLVDEAHRSHGSALHGNLLRALPNCARIGFTGTPIIMGARKRTHEIFGEFIDRYTIRQAEADGVTVPILYEGRTVHGAVSDGRNLDQVFEDMFAHHTEATLEAIKRKYATRGDVLEAEALVADKARDMLRHYVENILPNGFKAQVVAVSRRAAIRYQKAFEAARDELVAELEALDPSLLALDDEAVDGLPAHVGFRVRAHRWLDTLREIQFAAVISGGNNDDPDWKEYSDRAKVDNRIARFKKPLFHDDPERRDALAFLIVKSMLLTGFDAPFEQALYLDRHIQEAELLQAIARVNRTCDEKKTAGLVIDYYGVARHLKEALAAYTAEDVEGALGSLQDEIPKLRDRHRRVLDLFGSRGLDGIDDDDACVQLLRDDRLRAEFAVLLKGFLATLELVLPRPEALPFLKDSKQLGLIQIRARNLYRDETRPIGKEVGEKVRHLIDEHVISRGIDPTIPPISILDADFDRHVQEGTSDRARASEMEHAIRWHIRKHMDEDPERYQKLSERLDQILTDLQDRWTDLAEALQHLVEDARAGRQADDTGLDPETQLPFMALLQQAMVGDHPLPPENRARLADVTVEMVDHIRQEIGTVEFWRNHHAQDLLHRWVIQFMDDRDLLPYEQLPEVADRIVALARANDHRLRRCG